MTTETMVTMVTTVTTVTMAMSPHMEMKQSSMMRMAATSQMTLTEMPQPIATIGATQVIQPTLITPPPIMDMDPITMMMDAIFQQILMPTPMTGNTAQTCRGTHPTEWTMELVDLTAGPVSQHIPIPPPRQQIMDMDLNMTMTVVI